MSDGRYSAYPEYKDSGEEWLDRIPIAWKVLRGKFLFHEVSERSEQGEETLLSVSEYYGVKPRGEVVDEGDFLSRAESLEGYKKCQVNDLVMNIMLAWKRGLGVSKFDGIVSPAYSVFRFYKRANPDYMHYLLRTERYAGHFKTRSTGVIDSRLRLYPESFFDTSIIVPPIPEQTQIAKFLDYETAKIDRLIEKQQALIALLKEKRQAVISYAVTKGLNPHVPLKDSGIEWLGQVPAHWEIGKFGRFAFMQEGPGLRTWQFKDSGTRVICVTNITEDGIDFSRLEKFISDAEYKASYTHFTVNQSDILLSSSGNSWGKVARYGSNEPVILNTSTIRINELPHRPLLADYIQNFLRSEACREQLGIAMTGSCQPNFGPTHLNEVRVPVPPKNEQEAISRFIEKRIAEFAGPISACIGAVSLLQERRTALISAAVTGKIDVRAWQPPVVPERETTAVAAG